MTKGSFFCYPKIANLFYRYARLFKNLCCPNSSLKTMAKSGQSFNKREKERLRARKQQEKHEKMEERKAAKKEQSLEDMLAYVDENGNLSSTPPDPSKRKKISLDDIAIGVPSQKEAEPEDPNRNGTISFFNAAKGFGFIKDSRTGESIFFHKDRLSGPVAEGDKLIFEIEPGAKGPVAVRIQRP